MEKLFQFSINHWELVTLFFALLTGLVVTESRRGGRTVSSAELTALVNKSNGVVLDIRDSKDFRDGHITDSVNIPFSSVSDRLRELEQYKDKPVVIVCKMGQHSSSVGKTLRAAGFTDVGRLTGGIGSWQADGMPLVRK